MSKAKDAVFRFAPSPNGLLHLGHAYSAILTYELSKKQQGQLHLRIEDIDRARSEESYSAAILRDLHWLGIKWQQPVLYQSDNFEVYRSAIQALNKQGLLYPCFASRKEVKQALTATANIKQDPDGAPLYPAIYKTYPNEKAKERIASGEPFTLRLHMDKAIARAKRLQTGALTPLSYQAIKKDGLVANQMPLNEEQVASVPVQAERWGDVVIKRKDTPTSYHLSVVIDDHNLGVTHICRGKDLEAATDIHRILQINLGLDEPIYHHHDLLLYNEDKLSKSKGHPSLFELREQGVTPQEIYQSAIEGASALSKYLP